jgi:tRNA dimethylallyltransferase
LSHHIWLIVGPTASGKTALSLEMAKKLNCPILSADSRQIYIEMNIGTAKPTSEILERQKHYFINHISIEEKYDVNTYEIESKRLLEKLFETHNHVVIVGGTGLYIKALTSGLDPLPESQIHVRNFYENLLKERGIESLQHLLFEKDKAYYNKIDIHNPRRILRALEVIEITGMPISDQLTGVQKNLPYHIHEYYLCPSRQTLYKNINDRVDEMISSGLEDEVQNLLPYQQFQALQTVGYQEFFQYFDGNISKLEAIEKIKQHTRNYAKRQITWFNKFSNGNPFESIDSALMRFNQELLSKF